MVPTVLHIMSRWGDECFYRVNDEGEVEALREAGSWGSTHGYGGTFDSVIDFYCEGGEDDNWSYEWVEEGDAKYAS